MSDQSNLNFDGGESLQSGDLVNIQGGVGVSSVLTPGACTFTLNYKNVALNRSQIPLIDWTFKYKNQPAVGRFFKSSFNVCLQADVVDSINLAPFFHPLLSFSSYQKQTFVISPETSIDLDSSDFQNSGDEIGFFFARAYYLPTAENDEKVIFWEYGNNQRYPMGQIMCLSGAIKDGAAWKGWKTNPFETYGHTGPSSNLSLGGFSFTNPTKNAVKLVVITAN
jgi:hypothetical protein